VASTAASTIAPAAPCICSAAAPASGTTIGSAGSESYMPAARDPQLSLSARASRPSPPRLGGRRHGLERGGIEYVSAPTAAARSARRLAEPFHGGLASGTTISGGHQTIRGDATLELIRGGGSAVVSSGGVDSASTVDNGGFEIVLDAGVVTNTRSTRPAPRFRRAVASTAQLVSFGGRLIVSSGGIASGVTISSGGTIEELAGAILTNIHLLSGAIVQVDSGAVVSGTIVSGGRLAGARRGVSGTEITCSTAAT